MSAVLAQARLRACRHWPFASHAILSMIPVSRPGLGTLAVDQHWRLYFDEAALRQMDTEQAAGIILHELDHLLKRHHRRGKSLVGDDSSLWETWNFATDAAINEGLRAEGIVLPDGVIYPETVDQPVGLSAEEYFRRLADKQPRDSDSHRAGSGSCSDGRQRPWELGRPDDDNPGLDEADQEQLIHVTAQNVLDKQRGEGKGGMRVWAEQVIDPPLDPASKLLHLVRRCCDQTIGTGDRSYRRPSRRNSNPRMCLPSNVAPLPRITVIVDTSGSMGRTDLGLALGMIRKVLQSFRIRDGIRVVTGDTSGGLRQLCLSDPSKIDLTGGGGTDMAAIIAEVLEDRKRPQMILVCTDGYTPWPTENPGVPIVACLSNIAANLPDVYRVPDWMTILELKGTAT